MGLHCPLTDKDCVDARCVGIECARVADGWRNIAVPTTQMTTAQYKLLVEVRDRAKALALAGIAMPPADCNFERALHLLTVALTNEENGREG